MQGGKYRNETKVNVFVDPATPAGREHHDARRQRRLLRGRNPLAEAVGGHGRLGLSRGVGRLAVQVGEDGTDDGAVEHLRAL